ncbi:MAG: hypothetical protein HOQ10_14320 [Frateuria sp.]|nr:hypothetical protein [Frateuria sp.]
MSDNNPSYGFGKFVPGFDFLQNVAKGASQALPQMPNLSNWVAPTLNVEELEKRIGELRAVHFWLDQNSKALAATIQALEVQKMTLATLKGMNFNMAEMAEALKLKPTGASPEPQSADDGAKDAAHGSTGKRKAAAPAASGHGVVDPLQWWGALTQQFQQIAADAMKDAARGAGLDTVGEAAKSASRTAQSATAGSGAKPARKAAGKSPARKAARKATAR